MSEDLQAVIKRVIAGSRDEVDLQKLQAALQSNSLFPTSAPGSVSIGEDVMGSQVVTGSSNIAGNHNFVNNGADAQTIQTILSWYADLRQARTPIEKLDELAQQARLCCNERIQKLYGKVRLLNRKQIDVNRLYVDVYILEQLAGSTYSSIQKLLEMHDLENDRLALGKRQKRSPGVEIAKIYDKLVVLGKPGSGKTTFLKHLAIACCQGLFQPHQIPILIELREFSHGANINTFTVESLYNKILGELQFRFEKKLVLDFINADKILLLLDGLDELTEEGRKTIQRAIQNFSNTHFNTNVILTCRTQVMKENLNGFEYVEVADFNSGQVEQFVRNWFIEFGETSEQGAIQSENFLYKLKQPGNNQTAELAVTPILLRGACHLLRRKNRMIEASLSRCST